MSARSEKYMYDKSRLKMIILLLEMESRMKQPSSHVSLIWCDISHPFSGYKGSMHSRNPRFFAAKNIPPLALAGPPSPAFVGLLLLEILIGWKAWRKGIHVGTGHLKLNGPWRPQLKFLTHLTLFGDIRHEKIVRK